MNDRHLRTNSKFCPDNDRGGVSIMWTSTISFLRKLCSSHIISIKLVK